MTINVKTKEAIFGEWTRRVLFLSRMKNNRKVKALIFLMVLFLPFSFFSFSFAQQSSPAAKNQEAQAKAQPEKIVSGPQNIKESTAIYVFLGWMWVSIAVLIYFLRLKIKEADRLYVVKFFFPDKK